MSLLIPEKIPDSVDNALKNATDKPSLAVGNTFADLWYLVFGTISFHAEKRRIKYQVALEEFERSCKKKIEEIPEERLVEPDTQTAAAALEASKYCVENTEVREMFANLIASTMDSEKCKKAHPAFSDTIKQLSSIDAKYLSVFKSKTSYPICRYIVFVPNNRFKSALNNAFFVEQSEHSFASLEDSAISMDVLERLGIIRISYSERVADSSRYTIFENCKFYSDLQAKIKPGERIEIMHGSAELTDFGEALCAVCFPKPGIVRVTAQNPTIWDK